MKKIIIKIEKNEVGLYRATKETFINNELVSTEISSWKKSLAGFYSGAKKLNATIEKNF